MAYTYEEAKKQINFYKRTRGQYWNNIVSSILKQVADEHGKHIADALIRDCELKKYGWKEEGD